MSLPLSQMDHKTIKQELKIILVNINGIRKKIHEIRNFVKKTNPDILVITETKLLNALPPNINEYNYTHKNREARNAGGGVVIYYKNTIHATQEIIEINFESISLKIDDFRLTAVYNKPQQPIQESDLIKIFQNQEKVIAVGDWNARHSSWHNTNENTVGIQLKRLLDEMALIVVSPDTPTRISNNIDQADSILDFAITKNIQATAITLTDLNSDHLPVEFIVKKIIPLIKPPLIYNYKNAKWEDFRKDLNKEIKINRDLDTREKIDENIKTITNIIQKAIDIHIPKVDTSNKNSFPPELIETIKERNKLRKTYQRNKTQENLFNLLRKNIETKEMIQEHQEQQWQNRLKALEGKNKIWTSIKNRKNSNNQKSIPPLKETTNNTSRYITEEQEKTEFIATKLIEINNQNNHLSNEVTKAEVLRNYTQIKNIEITPPYEAHTNPYEIKRIIAKMRPFKAPGEDNIVPKILKNLPQKTIVQLNYIYNSSIKIQYFPTIWKNAVIIPIPKPRKPATEIKNLRPISLLTTMSKTFEKIIQKRLVRQLEDDEKLIPEQFGFRQSRSTELQLARIVDYAMINNNINNNTALVILDLEKAYDTVWIEALIHKMQLMEIQTYVIKLILSYLEDRTLQVKINQKKSSKMTQEVGLPQGSILSPTLFNIYLNDIPRHHSTELALFADDVAIYTRSTDENVAVQRIENHLENIRTYFDMWKLKAITDKTQFIIFNQKKIKQQKTLQFQNQIVNEKQEVKYLGVILDRKLNFTPHITSTRKLAGVAASIIFPYIAGDSQLQEKTKIRIYKAYVQPILNYAMPIWSSASKTNKNKIYSLENKLFRVIAKIDWRERTTNNYVHARLKQNNLRDVHQRRIHKFFNIKTRTLPITQNIGRQENINFRKKRN